MKSSDKSHRMALRRDAGLRAPPVPRTKSVAAYRVAHACFDCRKSFKVQPGSRQAKCPNCGGPAHWMGRSFKAPAASDRDQWKKVKALYDAGFRFFSYRSQDCEPFPARLADVQRFIRENPDHPYRKREA